MALVTRILVGLVGLFNVYLGLQFLTDPAGMAKSFYLLADGIQGLATVRADFTSFFTVAGVCTLYGAWKQRGDVLLVPILLFSIALSARFLALALDGRSPSAHEPMIAEAVMIAILLLGNRTMARRG